MGVLIQNGEASLTAAITNSGTITGSAGSGIAGFGNLDGFAVANSGAITGGGGDGVYFNLNSDETAVIDNAADATIEGSESGIHVENGAATITNAGTIHGDRKSTRLNSSH